MRGSWEPRAIDAWYVGPAYNNYRCWEFWVPATGGYRISGNGRFYPAHCKLPVEEPVDRIAREARALSNSIEEMMDGNRRLPGRHAEALKRLSDIFNLNLDIKQPQEAAKRPTYQTSSAPTSKAAVRAAPRAHNRVTRNNTPGILPTTEGARKRARPSTDETPIATSEGGQEQHKKEEVDWTLTEAEKERINEDVWTRVQGGRLTRAVDKQTSEGDRLTTTARKRTRIEVAANVYEALAEGDDEPMEIFKPSKGVVDWAKDKWNRARVREINEERKLRNEIRRIAREE